MRGTLTRRLILSLAVLACVTCAGAALADVPGAPLTGVVRDSMALGALGEAKEVCTRPINPGTTVTSGFLIILENLGEAPNDPNNWSDVVAFDVAPHAGSVVFMSDNLGDIASTLTSQGYTVAQVQAANTAYKLEAVSGTTIYVASTKSSGATVYYLTSDGSPSPSGSNPGCGTPAYTLALNEGATEFTTTPLPGGVTVTGGFVVMVENPNRPFWDPSNWSEVVAFNNPPRTPANQVQLFSDINRNIRGSLSAAGYSVTDVIDAVNVQYIQESLVANSTNYTPCAGTTVTINSDSPAGVPGLSPVGMGIMFALLAGTGLVFVMRRRRAGSEGIL